MSDIGSKLSLSCALFNFVFRGFGVKFESWDGTHQHAQSFLDCPLSARLCPHCTKVYWWHADHFRRSFYILVNMLLFEYFLTLSRSFADMDRPQIAGWNMPPQHIRETNSGEKKGNKTSKEGKWCQDTYFQQEDYSLRPHYPFIGVHCTHSYIPFWQLQPWTILTSTTLLYLLMRHQSVMPKYRLKHRALMPRHIERLCTKNFSLPPSLSYFG